MINTDAGRNIITKGTSINLGYEVESVVQRINTTNWITIYPHNFTINDLIWSPEPKLFMGVCDNNILLTGSGTVIDTEIEWTTSNISGTSSHNWNSIIWSPELQLFITSGSKIMRSHTGINWTSCITPTTSPYSSLCWSPNLLLACGFSSDTSIISSVNGYNWTSRINPISENIIDCVWSNNKFIAISDKSIIKSSDGISWTTVVSPTTTSIFNSICYIEPLDELVIVGDDGFMCKSNNDTISWTTINCTTNNLLNCCWSPQLSLLCISSVDILYTSADLLSFTSRSLFTGNYSGLCWSSYHNIFCSSSNNNIIINKASRILNKTIGLGTNGVSDTIIDGLTVEIGKKASSVSIGEYSDYITIGGIGLTDLKNSCVAMARYESFNIVYSKNISHIIKNSIGIYTVYFINALSNPNYYINVTNISNNQTYEHKSIEISMTQTVNGFSFKCRNASSNYVDGNFYIIVCV